MKLKARHITKLRKDISKMQTYKVAESDKLFGFEKYDNSYQLEVKATSVYHAKDRYFKWYYRSYKVKSRHSDTSDRETTYNWGTIKVIDQKGFKTYF